MKDKILVYGSQNWVGRAFCSYLNDEHVSWLSGNSRATASDQIVQEIEQKQPSHVVCFMDSKDRYTITDSIYCPLVLSYECSKRKIHFTFISNITDNKDGYTTDLEDYKRRVVCMFNDFLLNLRIKMPVTSKKHKNNYICKLIASNNKNSTDMQMTSLPDFFPLWKKMILDRESGVVNCVNPGTITIAEIKLLYNLIIGVPYGLINVKEVKDKDTILHGSNYHIVAYGNNPSVLMPDIKTSIMNILQNWVV